LVEHTTENRGVPSSSLGLAIAKDACMWAGFGAWGEAVWRVGARAVLRATSFSRPFQRRMAA
jgi:hypothetical protein